MRPVPARNALKFEEAAHGVYDAEDWQPEFADPDDAEKDAKIVNAVQNRDFGIPGIRKVSDDHILLNGKPTAVLVIERTDHPVVILAGLCHPNVPGPLVDLGALVEREIRKTHERH